MVKRIKKFLKKLWKGFKDLYRPKIIYVLAGKEVKDLKEIEEFKKIWNKQADEMNEFFKFPKIK